MPSLTLPRIPLLLTVVLFCLSLGCSGDSGESGTFSVTTEGGVVRAVSPGTPVYEGELFDYERVLVLEQDPDRTESLLYYGPHRHWDEPGFLMDADGRFYVQDRGNGRIAVFDAAGRFSHSIGRPGDGPGEFGFIYLNGFADGRLEIWDSARHRLSWFAPDGALERNLPSPIGGERIWYDAGDGLIVSREFAFEMIEEIEYVGAGFESRTPAGEPAGSAATPLVARSYPYYWEGHKGGVGHATMRFSCSPAMAWTPAGEIVLTNGLQPVLWLYRPDGTLVRTIEVRLPRVQVTRRDERAELAEIDRQLETAVGDERIILLSRRENITWPEQKSCWMSVAVDEAGFFRLRILEWDAGSDGAGPGWYCYVLSPEGEYLGTTRAPVVGRLMQGHMLGIVSDPDSGREDYTVWRIRPRPAGFTWPGR